MRRWGVAAGWVLLMACGARTDGPVGVSRTSGASPVADAGTDGGTVSCTVGGRLVASAGTGSLCGLKPVLGAPRTARAPLNVGNPDGGLPTEHCEGIGPSDGAGNINIQSVLFSLSAVGFGHVLYAFDSGGAPLGRTFVDALDATEFPLRAGWLVAAFLKNGNGFRISVYPPSLQAPSEALSLLLPSALTFRTPGGGAAVVGPLSPGDPSCPLGSTLLVATSFDASGAAVFRNVSLGCLSTGGLSVGRNARGDVLVLAGDSVAWHVTPDGIVSPVHPSPVGSLYPLIDGRFANRGDEAWLDTLDINGNVSPPPCWLAERPDVGSFQIVLEAKRISPTTRFLPLPEALLPSPSHATVTLNSSSPTGRPAASFPSPGPQRACLRPSRSAWTGR